MRPHGSLSPTEFRSFVLPKRSWTQLVNESYLFKHSRVKGTDFLLHLVLVVVCDLQWTFLTASNTLLHCIRLQRDVMIINNNRRDILRLCGGHQWW